MTESRHTPVPRDDAGRQSHPPADPPYPAFTRRVLLAMAVFAAALKLVNWSLNAMLVPPGAVQFITSLLLLVGLGYLIAFYFRRGPFRRPAVPPDA